MPFEIIHNDIVKMNTDAIVNAANSRLIMGAGVCGAIFKAAGIAELDKECRAIGSCAVGKAVITKGYNLQAKYIIHTVGPIWRDGTANEKEHLINAYKNSLELAKAYKLKSIAFPLISSGIYGYPKEEALSIAVSTISEFLLKHDMKVYLVVFDRKAVKLSENLFQDINHYIDEYYVEEAYYLSDTISYSRRERVVEEFQQIYEVEKTILDNTVERSLEDILNNIKESFSEMVLRLIDEKGKTDVEVYKKANIDRRLFSKIRSKKDYSPKKITALSLAIALELSLDETIDLLGKAGYTLSTSSKFDLIIQYFIESKNYDIYLINEALFSFEQPLLAM